MKKIAYVLLSVIVLLTTSCEIGLGSSVDTDPPSISIDSSIADKVIRGDFSMRGTWSDDGSIDNLWVVLNRTDGTGEALTFSGERTENPKSRGSGTWTAKIPATSETKPIIDGTYQADVYIKDSLGRTTVQSTMFTIDNTAPVIVLTRPSTTKDSTTADTYGQIFTIEGQAADTNNISRVEIYLYKNAACTIPVGDAEDPIVLKNVPLSISLDAANYSTDKYIYNGESESGEVKQFSIDVPQDSNGKEFYCKILAYDGASSYVDKDATATADDEKGNCADYYYLYKEIYSSILKDYKITELYTILDKTYTPDDTNRAAASTATTTPEAVKEDLESPTKYRRTVGRFILNPKNNPTYTVTGRSPLACDGTDFTGGTNDITNGQTVFIEVSPGLDDIPLDEDSIKIYAIECDKDGKAKQNATKMELDSEKEEKGTSFRFTVPLKRSKDDEVGLKIGKTYKFIVEGTDQSNNKIESSAGTGYGFRLTSSGNPPTLKIDTPASTTTYTKKNTKVTFTGSVEAEMGVPKIYVYKEDEEEPFYTINLDEQNAISTTSGVKYNFTYEHNFNGDEDDICKFTFQADVDDKMSQSIEKTIVYDVAAPVIEISKIVPGEEDILKYDTTKEDGTTIEGSYLNGSMQFTISISDAYDVVASAAYKINNGSLVTIDTPVRYVATIDTTKYTDLSNFTLTIIAKDRAGNESQYEKTFKIDQSTDLPVILPGDPSNISFKYSTVSAFNAQPATGRKGMATTSTPVSIILHDDDGIASLVVKRSAKITNDSVTPTWTSETITNLSQPSFRMPEDGGLYKFEIIATDKNGLSKSTGVFVLNATRDAATITGIKTTPEYRKGVVGQKYTNVISGINSEGPYKLYRKIEGINEDFVAVEDKQSEAQLPITDVIDVQDLLQNGNPVSDEIEVYYYVLDASPRPSNKNTKTVLYIDDDEPTVEIKSPVTGKTDTKALTETVQFTGKANDAKSGVTKVWYKFTHSANAGTAIGTAGGYEFTDAFNGPFAIDIPFKAGTAADHEDGKLEEGKWYLHVYSEDDAGNYSTVASREFDIDFNDPSLEAEITESANCKYSEGSNIWYFKGDLIGTLNASDTSGPVEVDFKFDDASGFYQLEENYTDWKAFADNFTESTQHKLTIKVKDGFQKTNSLSFNVYKDTKGPSITITDPGNVFGDSVTLNGSVTDGTGVGVAAVKWSTTQNGTYTEIDYQKNHGSWTKTFSTSNSTVLNTEGTKTFWFKAIDELGNEGSPQKVVFEYDQSLPQLKPTDSYTETLNYINKNITGSAFKLIGIAWDSNKLANVKLRKNSDSAEELTLTGTVANAIDEASAVTWEKEFKVGSSNSGATNYLNDGNYTFTLYATDVADRQSEVITKKFTVDTVAPEIKVNSWPGKENTKASSFIFRGTAVDVTSEIQTLKLTISDGTNPEDFAVEGTDSWSCEIKYKNDDGSYKPVFASQGVKTVTLYAKDYARNETTEFKLKNTDGTYGTAITSNTFIYDRENPVLEIDESSILEYMPEDGLTITGTASDSYKLADNAIIVTQTKSGTAGSRTKKILKTDFTGTDNDKWSVKVPFKEDGTFETPVDGITYSYSFQLYDSVGNTDTETPKQYKTEVDLLKPVLAITKPQGLTGTSAINTSTYQFTGTYTEKNISAMYYQIVGASDTAPAIPAVTSCLDATAWTSKGWTSIVYGKTDWSFFEQFKNRGASGSGKEEGKYKIYVYAVDKAANMNATTVSSAFDVDMAAPVITTQLDTEALTSDLQTKEIENVKKFNFTITETHGLNTAKTEVVVKKAGAALSLATDYKIKQGSTEITNVTAIEPGKNYIVELQNPDDATYTFEIKVEDVVGKKTTVTRNILLDTTPPHSVHVIDGSTDSSDNPNPKDLYFRIGTQNREDGVVKNQAGTITSADPEWDDDLDKDVGAKYSNGTYGNDTSIEIRGRFEDSGTGVKEIYYKIYKEGEEHFYTHTSVLPDATTVTALDNLKNEVLNSPDGSYALRPDDEKRVFYTKSERYGLPVGDNNTEDYITTSTGEKKYYITIATNFREKLTGFNEGNNYLVFVAVDNVGNSSIDYVTIKDGTTYVTYPNFSLNIDRTPPELTTDTTETIYTNANAGSTIELRGTVTDGPTDACAGVDRVVILHPTSKDANGDPIELAEATVNGSAWSYTLDATVFADASGSTPVYAKAYDKAGSGNWTKIEVAKVVVDQTYPTISLDDITDADESATATGTQVNGKIQLSGSAGDKIGDVNNTKFTVTKIKYKKSTESTWVELTNDNHAGMSDFHIASSENFTVTGFDTTKLTDKATYAICAVVKDNAGNETESASKEVIVDQDSDKPVINLSNVTLQATGSSYLKNQKKLYLSVTDDDGVQSIKYKVGNGSLTTLSGSSIDFSNETDDGAKTIYFEITDKAGRTFKTTDSTNTTEKPKISDGTTTRNDGDLVINLVTKKPTVTDIEYSIFDAKETDTSKQWSDWKTSAGVVGGTRFTKFKMRLKASSAQTISAANATYNSVDYNFTCDDATYNNAYPHIWTSVEIPVVSTTDFIGDQTIDLIVQDGVPNDPMEYEGTPTITIDNVKPTISISKTSTLIGQEETIKGTVNDTYDPVTLYYAVSRYCEMKTVSGVSVPDESKPYTTTVVQPQDTVRKSGTTVLATAWTKLESEENGNSWYVYFDDGTETDHTKKLGTYLTEDYLGITKKDLITAGTYEVRTPVYFWIKAVDPCGNEKIEYKKLDIDPQGERPRVEITYPTNVANVAPTLGGTIRMTGTAEDNNSAKYAWVQVDYEEPVGFSQAELTHLKEKGYKIGKISTNTEVPSAPTDLGDGVNAASDYGIMVDVKGTGWSQALNAGKEFNPESGTRTLRITVYATDEDSTPHKSLAATQTVIIDSNKPYVEQSSLELVQYDSNHNISARKAYSNDITISGIWYLTGNINDDDSGIEKIKYKGEARVSSSGSEFTSSSDANFWFKKVEKTVTKDNTSVTIYNYQFSVPLGTSETGKVGTDTASFEITEKSDETVEPITPSYSVVYDTKAPVLNTDTTNSLVNLERNVQNSNGFYTFGAIASEDNVTVNGSEISQSGVERIAFYFTRDLNYGLHGGSTTNDLFDVMIYHKNVDADDIASGNMITNYKSRTREDGLYWTSHTGTVSGTSFTYTGAVDKNIHKKGLVKIHGTIYLIDDVDENLVTLDSAPGDTKSGETTTALFALCNVIDANNKNGSSKYETKGYGYGYYRSRDNDDGDLITESFSKQNTDWIFDASINSKNLPDGPVTLHLVAFDKAGNIAEWASTPASGQTSTDLDFVVSNNAPRIAGMKIGTDENGNGKVDSSEMAESYSNQYALGYDKSGNEIRDLTLPVQIESATTPTAAVKAKGRTVIEPELVGGNGTISYKYKVYTLDSGKTFNETVYYEKTDSVEIASGTTDEVASLTVQNTTTGEKGIILSVEDFVKLKSGSTTDQQIPDGYTKFEFLFSDSTPGKTSATGSSNSSTLNVIMNVALRDTTNAHNWILPFYWKSSSDNSLFGESKDNGHIELAEDWVRSSVYSTSVSSGEYDADPKVSGMIKIEGIAYDETLLSSITVQFGTSMGGLGTTEKTIASYDNSNWSVTALGNDGTINSTTGWASAIQQATYGELVKVGLLDSAKVTDNEAAVGTTVNGIKKEYLSTALVPETSQKFGHVVHWILYVNTAKVSGVAANDVTVTAKASDRGSPSMNGSSVVYTTSGKTVTGSGNSGVVSITGSGATATVTTGGLTGTYSMDVVPYISSLKTEDRTNSGLKENNIRSASGKYSVIKGNTNNFITVEGFNLSPTAAVIVNKDAVKGKTITTTNALSISTPASTYTSFGIKNNISNSGYLELLVNGVRTLNNINYDDSYGSYTITGKDSNNQPKASATDYTNYYNREADLYTTKNIQLTDDRYILMWDMKSTGIKNGYYPVMIMKGNNPVFGYINKTGGTDGTPTATGTDTYAGSYYPSHAMPQRSEFNGTSAELTVPKIYTEYLIKASTWDQMGMAVDEEGRYYNVSVYNRDTCAMSIIYDRYAEIETSDSGTGTGWGAGNGYQAYKGSSSDELNNNAITLETVNYNSNLHTERYQYPKLIVKGKSKSEAASVYMLYYDDATGELLFRDFKIGKTLDEYNVEISTTYSFTHQTYNNADYYTTNSTSLGSNSYVKIGSNYYKITYFGKSGTSTGWYSIEDYDGNINTFTSQLFQPAYLDQSATDITNTQYEQKVNFIENKSNSSSYSDGRLQIATTGSKYFDMGVTSDNRVVIAYVDSKSNKLVYRYSKNAVDGSNPTENIEWNPLEIEFPDNVGSYVSMAIDGNSVHIAAFDSYDSNLVYMYLPNYNSATGFKKITVDQASAVGNWTQIKVKNHIPYISYYNSTETGGRDCIKLAYPIATSGKTAVQNKEESGVNVEPGTPYAVGGRSAGAATGYTTGAWEYMTVPALTPPQGGDPKFQNVCLDFDESGTPVVGYLGTNLEFGKQLLEAE